MDMVFLNLYEPKLEDIIIMELDLTKNRNNGILKFSVEIAQQPIINNEIAWNNINCQKKWRFAIALFVEQTSIALL